MPRSLHLGSVVPPGLVVGHIEVGSGALLMQSASPNAD